MTMIRTQINLEEEQYRLLQLEAQLNKRSLSGIIREVIDKGFMMKQRSKKKYTLLDIAKHATKGEKDIPNDISENHDEYLYGKKSKFAFVWKRPTK